MSESSSPRLLIHVHADDGEGESLEFETDSTIQIGRQSDSDVVVDHPRVSRSHATVFFDGGVWQFSSIGSNGSFMNDEAVKHVLIEDGTAIRLGRDGGLIEFHTISDDDSGEAGTITAYIGGMKEGDEESVTELWAHCFASVARIARNQMSGTARRMTDEEDVAASVFESLYFSTVQGKLPDLSNRESLWRLIVVMTRRKVADYVNREKALKRGGGRVRGDSIGPPDSAGAFDQFVSETPSPVKVAMIEEQTDRLLTLLPSDEHRNIALCRLEGNTVTETAETLNLSVRTVERRLQQIRTLWDDELQTADDSVDGEA